jgi:hypothetical protein
MPLEMMCIIIALYRSTKNVRKLKEKKNQKTFPEYVDVQYNVCGICFETRPHRNNHRDALLCLGLDF